MIMGHCHLFPGGFGEDRRDAFGIPGTAEHLRGFIEACGFEQAQVLAPHEGPADASVKARIDAAEDGLDWLLAQPAVGLDGSATFLPAATIRPDAPDACAKLQRARALGIRMLKLHPLIQRFNPLDGGCRAFFEDADRARMSVVYHTGSGKWNWTDASGRPEVCAELAGRHPGLRILMAHCGTFAGADGFEAALGVCEQHPNLYLDTTAALLDVGADAWKRAIDRAGVARVIYGNDYPWASRESVAAECDFIRSLGLRSEDEQRVLGGNLLALWQTAAP